MSLTQSKSLLAKLMATENLHIEQRNVSTASFDVENRILTVPVLDKQVTNNQYDLFIGHEVAHALYTPLDGLKKAFEEGMSMSVLNVVEDSRIERKIKMKYPGLRQIFIKAYKELLEKDFFGTADQDLNNLNFIDRINLYCKGGIDLGIQFSDEEKIILNEVENTVTYDDVMKVTKKICSQMTEEEKQRPSTSFDDDYEYDEDDFDGENGQSGPTKGDSKDSNSKSDSSEESDDNSGNGQSKNSSKSDEPSKSSGDSNQKAGSGFAGANTNKPISHTDEAFRKNEHRLFSNDGTKYYYGNIPKVNIDEVVMDHKVLWKNYRDDVSVRAEIYKNNYGVTLDGTDKKAFQKFREDSKKVVSFLVKEFELRKNADQMKRASVAKTGELNMSKIYSYGFSEDIFRRLTVVPQGKSHGLVMFIDWSGSMNGHMDNTIRQLLNLVMFCKKVNIPYEVYAFTSGHRSTKRIPPKKGDMIFDDFLLMNLLSNRMSAIEYSYAASALMAFSTRNIRPDWFSLSGTPLNEAVISAMEIVPKFRKNNKLQVVNTVFLTDGEGQKNLNVYNSVGGSEYTRNSKASFIIRDPVTKHEVSVKEPAWSRDLTSAYVKLLKERTQSHVVGFYILSGREFGHNISKIEDREISLFEQNEMKAQFRKNKYKVVTTEGYDEYYLLYAEGLDTDDDVEFEVKENATTRGFVSAFSKFSNNRKANRVVLNRFIGLIA